MLPRWSSLPTGFSSGLASRLPIIGDIWRDELRVLLQPHQLVLTRLGGWRKTRVVYEDVIAVVRQSSVHSESNTPGMVNGVPPTPWQAALHQLAVTMRDAQWQGCQPRVILSNHFVRYVLIPWNASLSKPDEQRAFVRHCFTQAYGEPARQWDIRTSPAGYGKPSMASSVEPDLIQALRLCFAEAGMHLQNIHPLMMQAINETRRQLGKQTKSQQAEKSLCLAVLEQGRLAVLLQQNNDWRSLQCHAASIDALPALIQRDAIISGLESDHWPLVVYSAEPGMPRLNITGRKLHQLSREIPFLRQPDLAKVAS